MGCAAPDRGNARRQLNAAIPSRYRTVAPAQERRYGSGIEHGTRGAVTCRSRVAALRVCDTDPRHGAARFGNVSVLRRVRGGKGEVMGTRTDVGTVDVEPMSVHDALDAAFQLREHVRVFVISDGNGRTLGEVRTDLTTETYTARCFDCGSQRRLFAGFFDAVSWVEDDQHA